MTLVGAVQAAYLVSALLFIGALAGLSRHETARRGNRLGVAGMVLALVATLALAADGAARGPGPTLGLAAAALLVGGGIGAWRARRVEMTGMPELIAVLHSFVGVAAVLVGINTFLETGSGRTADVGLLVEIAVGVLVGGVTFTGSVLAWGKLSGRVRSAPLALPRRHLLTLGLLVAGAGLAAWLVLSPGVAVLLVLVAVSLLLGLHLVAGIGGGDMPVVVSMLNSYSGWAAAAAGFMLGNDLLIITGALVGSSGAILSYYMCQGMNRSFWSVVAGGFGSDGGVVGEARDYGAHRETSAAAVAELLRGARSVVVAPGYGMAVAQAQHPVASLAHRLENLGVEVRFGIHPVAGRLPGHMNVLLAEARVPYDVVLGLDAVNARLPGTDVVLVIGANDTVNPAAQEEPGSPIAGMPVLEVWRARDVVVFKRSMATGYAGVQNPLFFRDNTQMLFGDAKDRVEEILAALHQH